MADGTDQHAVFGQKLIENNKARGADDLTVSVSELWSHIIGKGRDAKQRAADLSTLISRVSSSEMYSLFGDLWAESPTEGSARFHECFGLWSEINPREALEWADRLNHVNNYSVVRLAVNKPEVIRACYNDPRLSTKMGLYLSHGFYEWAQLDRVGALTWLDDGTDTEAKVQMMGRNIRSKLGAGSYDEPTPLVIDLISRLPAGSEKTSLFKDALFEWGRQDAEAALNWASEYAEPDVQETAIALGVTILADQNPRAAIEQIDALSDGYGKKLAQQQLAVVWAAVEPEEAYTWLSSAQPDWLTSVQRDEIERQTTEKLTAIWMNQDSESALSWAAKQSDSESAYAKLGRSLECMVSIRDGITFAPEQAIDLLDKFPDAYKGGHLYNIMSNWYSVDRAGAADYTAKHPAFAQDYKRQFGIELPMNGSN